MLCPKCGVENESRMYYCVSCGFELSDEASRRRSTSFPAAEVVYAGFWRRAAALIIDSFLLVIAGGIIGMFLGILFGLVMDISGVGTAAVEKTATSIGNIFGLTLNWLYFTLMESSSRQATAGKMALGIVVTDPEGRPVSFARANGRYWSKIISGLIMGVGFLMAGFTRNKQALHDIIASTLVVKKRQ